MEINNGQDQPEGMHYRPWLSWQTLIILLVLIGLVIMVILRLLPVLRPVTRIPRKPKNAGTPGSINKTNLPLRIPKGFRIETFASHLGPARFMALDPNGVLLVSVTEEGKVLALPDRNHDGRADQIITLLKDLNLPHGLAFHKGYLYVAETDKVIRYKYTSRLADGVNIKILDPQVVVPGLPSGGEHVTRSLGFGPDGRMYVSVGSSGNVVKESDPHRAAILSFKDDGTDAQIYARGLRNSVGFTWHPITKGLWATDNGRDFLGDNLPPDEINIVKKGGDYGWPYAYGNRIPDPEFSDARRAAETLPPKIEIQAHSAPLGLCFYDAAAFGPDYKDDLFVCFHGSWNRSVPTGYRVVRYHLTGSRKDQVAYKEDFVTGWLTHRGVLGRPVDVIVGADQALCISDDKAGIIYRISKIK